MILEVAMTCMLVGYVNVEKKSVHTETRGCAIEQHITPDGGLSIERTDNGRNVIIYFPLKAKSFIFYYTFGEDEICFATEDGSQSLGCKPVSTGWGSV